MSSKPSYEELEKKIQELGQIESELKQAQEINKTLFALSDAVNTTPDIQNLYQSIHNSLGSIIDVTNFFIAIVDMKKRTLYFPYHVDTKDKDFSPIANFDTSESLSGMVVSQRRPMLLEKKELEKRAGQNGIWGPTPKIWMGVPLLIKDEVIGVIAVQSYLASTLYTKKDLKILSLVSDQIAIAIDRKRSVDALQKSEKRYRHLFKTAPAGIYEIDFVKGKFINVNKLMCKYSGYSEKELLALNPLDLLTADSKKLYLQRFERLSKGENLPGNVEYTLLTKNGRKTFFILNSDFTYKNGKLVGAQVVTHDITGFRQAEEEKIKAQKIIGEQKKMALVGQIAGKMAHDFNNILGIIMGNTELALLDCTEEEKRKTLKKIFKQTIRGKNLTLNLAAFAKDQEPKQEFFRINEKIDLVINLLGKDLKGIEVSRDDRLGVPELLADPGMIEHALINLIQNSIHATSMNKSPKIIIRTHCSGKNIYFEIEDNGCGIPKEHMEKIYEPSFTLKGNRDVTASYKAGIKGIGYGMSNAKKYIQQHQGNISMESEFGSGTKFTIRLPIVEKELTSREKTELEKEKIHSHKSILLVEDEQAISDVQYRILTQKPLAHNVDIAHNGQIAKDLFKKNQYDLVSLDYVLPGETNGMDIYKHIRKTNKTIPILFVSGNIEFLESIKDLKQSDANIDHLSKPCQNKIYVKRINELFEKTLS